MSALQHEFVDLIPDVLINGTLYVSVHYATVVHRCCCGCGGEVVTPLTPTDWKLSFDGESISLFPSISGSTSGCGTHYWIDRNRVRWSVPLTPEQTADRRHRDKEAKEAYFDGEIDLHVGRRTRWRRLVNWFSNLRA